MDAKKSKGRPKNRLVAPKRKSDITPEMIEAGAKVLYESYDLVGFIQAKGIAVDVYQAMRASRVS